MNPLCVELQTNTSYTGVGNSFSRFLLVSGNLTTYKAISILTEDSYTVKQYQKLCEYFEIPFFTCENEYELVYLQHHVSGIYALDIELLETRISEKIQEKHIRTGGKSNILQDIQDISNLGYEYQEYGKKGSYKRQGDTLHIYDFSGYFHYTISYWGDEVEEVFQETLYGEKVVGNIKVETCIVGSNKKIEQEAGKNTLMKLFQESSCFTIFDSVEFYPSYNTLVASVKNSCSFDIMGDSSRTRKNLTIEEVSIDTLEVFGSTLKDTQKQVYIYTKRKKLIDEFLSYNEIKNIQVQEVTTHILKSFRVDASSDHKQQVYVICDDVISKVFIKKRVSKKLSEDIDLLLKINKGDYIIHIDHGIGVFHDIVSKQFGKVEKEYIELHYKDNDRLFVPITEVSRVSKYIGIENPKLTPLSGKIWEKKMAKIREDIREIAEQLLSTFAERKLRPGIPFKLNQTAIERFRDKFPYTYTECQENAIEDILTDMQQETTMERLLVGDVGFGKTEVAFNAIFNALCNKKQVAFIAPLVVLAYEHYEKALERFADMGFSIAVLTRMESQRNITQALKGLKEGTIDLIIGTHKLLGKNVHFKHLGLIVVDEEHKFGVTDKEKIKVLQSQIDVLSMSATPIPRSLNLALSGVRDISILKTPPEGRKNIETYISPYEEKVIQDAGNKEFARGGQVFFVHNRVVNIEIYKKNIQKLFPTKKIVITHGQLPGDELEDRIMAFKHKKYDILLSTTVIENGIDFSNVNTIFINECQSFGISQLHQLRGRVGRSDKKGYCYLLYKKETLSNESAKRLQTIVNYSYLGAGFELAMKDLEIRGGGDILGIRQSGQVQEIGVSLFLKMLEEKIQQLKENPEKPQESKLDISIDLQISASIPEEYFQSETDKIHFYREVESLSEIEELEEIITGFKKINEDLPESAHNVFDILKVKILGQKYAIKSIKRIGINYQIDFKEHMTLPELKEFLSLDKEVRFAVTEIKRLRADTKLFANDKNFLQYLLDMFEKKIGNPKIKIKMKK